MLNPDGAVYLIIVTVFVFFSILHMPETKDRNEVKCANLPKLHLKYPLKLFLVFRGWVETDSMTSSA